MTALAPPIGAFLYVKLYGVAMKKRYTQKEIEILSKNPNVKHARENRITLTYEFRIKLYEHWCNGVSAKIVLEENSFDTNLLGSNFINSIIVNFKKHGKPSGAQNKKIHMYANTFHNTDEEIKLLLSSGLFVKSSTGIGFHPEFINELYHDYPTKSIEEGIQTHGIDPKIVGYQRIYQLKRQFDGEDIIKITTSYDVSVIEQLKDHPYIKRITMKQMVFHEQFYQEALCLKSMHIDRILEIFEIEPKLIYPKTKIRIKYQLSKLQKANCTPIVTKDINLLCKIENNRHIAMMELIDTAFAQCKECITYLSKAKRKALCQLIAKMPKDNENKYTIQAVLKKIGISKTSYYDILQNKSYGLREQQQKEQDQKDIKIIKEVIDYKGYPKGSRMIQMMMPNITEKSFSRGKILRLMRRGNLKCNIRKTNLHKRACKKMIERNTKENKLKRRFRLERPFVNLVTDVSYLKYGYNQTAYLSCVKDASSGRILGNVVSEYNDETLADDTLLELRNIEIREYSLLHSDQGILYLSPHYQQQVKDMGFTQSMSRRGNCWDNASQESFFGHFKDEVDYLNSTGIEGVASLVQDYMEYYNYERPQWTRNKMTPVAFESYLMDMSDDEFEVYQTVEKVKYEEMMKKAAIKAKKRATDIGVDA
ncbi:MAG: IS3 family transposase [Longicatena sp.]